MRYHLKVVIKFYIRKFQSSKKESHNNFQSDFWICLLLHLENESHLEMSILIIIIILLKKKEKNTFSMLKCFLKFNYIFNNISWLWNIKSKWVSRPFWIFILSNAKHEESIVIGLAASSTSKVLQAKTTEPMG